MHLIIEKTSRLKGQVVIPRSKSHSIRAIILAALAQGKSVIKNPLYSNDTQDAISAFQQLNAEITTFQDALTIQSNGLPLNISVKEIHTGNSGITTHCMLPILGLRQNTDPVILNCSDQMRARPIHLFVKTLEKLGLTISYLKNTPMLPVSISGNLIGGKVEIKGMTSQPLSALLLTLPCALNDSEITVKNLRSRPYVDMTLQYLKSQKIIIHHESVMKTDTYYIKGKQTYRPFNTLIPGDFSSASYLIAAGVLLVGEIVLEGLSMADQQGDKKLVLILKEMGADIEIHKTSLHIRGGKKLNGMIIDANDIPDLLPTLAVIGCFAKGQTHIVNCAHARIKETDRIYSMSEGLKRMGAKIEEKEDGLTIHESQLEGACVKGYGDHRTVMALSVAGMIANGITHIDDAQAIDKTFPDFVNVMTSLGSMMKLKNITSHANTHVSN